MCILLDSNEMGSVSVIITVVDIKSSGGKASLVHRPFPAFQIILGVR